MSISRGQSGWRSIAALAGFIAVIIGYFWGHKPFGPELIAALGGAALDLLTVVFIGVVAAGVGRRGLERVEPDSLSRAERVALEGLLGLGILSSVFAFLGLAGGYQPLYFWGMLIAGGILGFQPVMGWLRDLRNVFRPAIRPDGLWSRFWVVITVLLLTTAVLHALAPPTAYDALNYHLVGPQRYLRAGAIVAVPDHVFMGFPQGVEILYGVAMGLFGRDTSPALLHGWYGLLGLLAVGGLVKRYTDSSTAYLAAALITSAFSVWLLFGWAYVDLAMLAYGACALVLVALWRERQSEAVSGQRSAQKSSDEGFAIPDSGLGTQHSALATRNSVLITQTLLLLGLMLGFAASTKYAAAGLVGAVLIYLLVHAPRQFIRNALIMVMMMAVAYAPWALKGLLLYQNPIYPFVFGGLTWDAARSATFSTSGMGLLAVGKAWQLPILPLAATVFGVEKGETYSFTIGPWLLTAPFLLVLGWRWLDDRARTLARDAVIIALPLLAYWMFLAATTGIGAQSRLMLMGLPAAAVLAAIGFTSLGKWPRKPLDVGFLARALLVLTLCLAALDAVRDTVQAKVVPYLLGFSSREDYLLGKLGSYRVMLNKLAELPDGTRVRFLFEPFTYDCPAHITCQGDILFDFWAHPLQQGATADEVFQQWRGAGDDYVLMFNLGYTANAQDPRFSRENVLLPDGLDQHMTPVWSDRAGDYTLYGWKG